MCIKWFLMQQQSSINSAWTCPALALALAVPAFHKVTVSITSRLTLKKLLHRLHFFSYDYFTTFWHRTRRDERRRIMIDSCKETMTLAEEKLSPLSTHLTEEQTHRPGKGEKPVLSASPSRQIWINIICCERNWRWEGKKKIVLRMKTSTISK